MTKEWRVNAENLKEYYKRTKALLEQQCKLVLIHRNDNMAGKLLEGMLGYRHARSD